MRPFTVLLGILLGSAASITFGLGAVAIIFVIIVRLHPDLSPDLSPELPRLSVSLLVFAILTAFSASSFLGQLRARAWAFWAHLATATCLIGIFMLYWPRRA
jgi:hypothetical protein